MVNNNFYKDIITVLQKIEDSDRFWVPMMWKKLASKMFDHSLTRR